MPKILIVLAFYGFIPVSSVVADAEKIYTGCYSCCFESNTFVSIPNSSNERWDVVSRPGNFWDGISKVPQQKNETIYFLKVKAKLGETGQFGHMGLANREMEITKVLEFRELRESDGVCDIPLPPDDISDPDFKER